MGSFAGEDECPGGVTGADAEVGALVWVRRRNGSWWPGRILGMDELPENCVIPPRSAGTPIKLLGRPDGSIDWYNLEKSKRVKSFRCGEYDEWIEKAKDLARQQKRTHVQSAVGRYVRREDAIIHALEIERSRFPNKDDLDEDSDDDDDDDDDDVCASQTLCPAKSKNINGLNKRHRNARGLCGTEGNSVQEKMSQSLVVYKQPQNTSPSSTRYASSSSKKKRKGQKDLEGDTVRGFQRMRDLREIGTKNVFKQKFGAGIFSDAHQDVPLLESEPNFGYDLSSTSGIKKSKQSHLSIKKKRSNIGQSYENSRKKDRRHPLSKFCEDSEVTVPTYSQWNSSGQSSSQYQGDQIPNLFEPSRERTIFPADVNNCSYSLDASSLETLLDTSCTNHAGPAMATVKDVEVSCTSGFINDDCPDGDEFDALTLEGDGMEEGHLNTYGSCTSIKDRNTDCSKVGMSPVQHQRSSKEKSLSSVAPISKESDKMDKNVLLQQCDGTIKLDSSVCKATELEGNMGFAMPELDKSADTISNHSNSEKGTASFSYCVPLQVIVPEQQHDLKPPRCHVMRPTKRACADYRLYDVEVAVQGSYKGHHAPLVSLLSKWTGKPIVGYPVTVEDLEDSVPAASRGRHHPAMGSLDSLLRSRAAEPRQARSSNKSRPKSSEGKKGSENDLDKSWRPHTKKPASSPRKMRRLSSFASSQRESTSRNPVVAKTGGPTVACVPLRLVFSRINEALSLPVRQENPT